jgi:hypothetical protein
MDSKEFAINKASKVFDYFYTKALEEFGTEHAKQLAQVPADYVYNQLIINYPNNCYIDSGCCLEYCNEVIDKDFKIINPEIKKKAYEKAYNVSIGNISMSEINLRLKSKRRSTGLNKKYMDAVNNLKLKREENLSSLFEGIEINKINVNDISDLIKRYKI